MIIDALGGLRLADGFLIQRPAFRVQQIGEVIRRVFGVFDPNRRDPAIGAADGETTIAIQMNIHGRSVAPGDQQRRVEHGRVKPQIPRLPGGAADQALAQRPVPGQVVAVIREAGQARQQAAGVQRQQTRAQIAVGRCGTAISQNQMRNRLPTADGVVLAKQVQPADGVVSIQQEGVHSVGIGIVFGGQH